MVISKLDLVSSLFGIIGLFLAYVTKSLTCERGLDFTSMSGKKDALPVADEVSGMGEVP